MYLLFMFFHLFSPGNSHEVERMEELYQPNKKNSKFLFIAKYEKEESLTIQETFCTIGMKQSSYPTDPCKKLSNFKKLKEKKLVDKDPTNIHLRYLRYTIQLNCPAILGYKSTMPDDAILLKEYISNDRKNGSLSRYIKKNCFL